MNPPMTHTTEKSALPDYGNPPVVETVVGVQFQPLSGFTNAHLGAFWQALGIAEWPTVQDVPPLPRQEERFTPEAQWGKALRLQLTQNPASRLQIRNRDGNRTLQLQNGRMHLNWLGEGGDRYPRYSQVRTEFDNLLTQLARFVDASQLGVLTPDQWEVTYVNKIRQGLWQTPADWNFFRPLNGMPSIDGVIEPESFTGEWHFVIPGERGRLHIHWQHARESDSDEDSHVLLTLTARGPIGNETEFNSSVLAGIDLGRETIVRSFQCLMSDPANKEWELKNASDR